MGVTDSNPYAYTPDGKLATRTWARGIVTAYAYDFAGNLTNVMQNAECRMQNGGGGNPSTLQPFNPSTIRSTYDADGNMLPDGRFRDTWNAENRLVGAQELCAPTNRSPYTIAYAYDHRV